MDRDAPSATHPVGHGSPAAAPAAWWTYEGVGWPRSWAALSPLHVATVLAVALTVWGYVDVGPRGRIVAGHPERHKKDVTVFTEAGAAFFDGRNPYNVANPRGWHYLYPPLFALLVAPLTVFDTETQTIVWYVASIAMGFGGYVEARRLGRLLAPGVDERFGRQLGIAAAAAVILPSLDCLQCGQLGIALVYLLMLGSRLAIERRSWRGGALGGLVLALPAAVKLVPAFPVMVLVGLRWLAVVRPRRGGRRPWGAAAGLSAGVAVGLFLFLFAVPSALIGWKKNLASLETWRARVVANERVGSKANFNIHSPRNQSLANALFLLGHTTSLRGGADRPMPATRTAGAAVPWAVAAILGLIGAVALAVARRDDAPSEALVFGLACVGMLVISPLSWGHYYMAELPAVVGVALWLERRGRRRAASVLSVAPAVLAWIHFPAVQQAGAIGLLGLGTALWLVAACVIALRVELGQPGEVGAETPAVAEGRRPIRTAA